MSRGSTGAGQNKGQLKKNVYLFGWTSFFTDMSSEMIYPLLTGFLNSLVAGTSRSIGAFLGVIEGIAEATSSLGKVYFGYLADKLKNYKALTIVGYAFSAVSKIIFVFSSSWTHVMGGRFSDRVGKSVRSAPRDAIMSESVNKDERGKMFGIQRAMDFSGAFMGGLIALLLVHFLGPQFKVDGFLTPDFFRTAFLISLIPAGLGVVILFFVKEPETLTSKEGKKFIPLTFKGLDGKLRIFLLATFIFGLGNSSNQFLILVTQDIGWTLLMSTAMYLLYNLVSALLLPYFGKLSDKIGRRKVILAGYLLYAIVYLGFGLFKVMDFKYAFILLWVLYGVYSAMTEGVEKAYVADLSPVDKRGTSLGLFATINGIALLPASIGAGLLYVLNPALPFLVGGTLGLISTLLIFLSRERG